MADAPLKILSIAVVDRILGDNLGSSREVASELASREGQVHTLVYSPRSHGYETRSLSLHLTVHPTRSRNKLAFFRDAYRLGCQLHAEVGFDLITAADPMGSGLVGYWLARRYGLPLSLLCHTDYFSSLAWRMERPRYWLDYLLAIYLMQRADMVSVRSQAQARSLKRLGIAPERISMQPPTMRTALFRPGPSDLARYAAGELLFVGRLIPCKGLPTLRALALLARRGLRPRFTLAGDGPLLPRLQRMAKRLGLESQVRLLGHVAHPDTVSLYQSSSALVVPSHYEAFGKVIVEGGLCGLPIVGSAVGGIPELVIPEVTGLLAPPRKPHALADALERLLRDPAAAQRMGQEAARRFRHDWDSATTRDARSATYRHVVAEHARRHAPSAGASPAQGA